MDVLRSPFYQEVPQAFGFAQVEGETRLAGAYAQIIKQFAEYHDYELQLHPVDHYKVSEVQRNIEHGIYNLSLNAGTYRNQFANITFSYPVEWSKVCIMVPAEDELPRYWYVVWPFGPYIWTMIHVSVIYVALFMRFLKHPTPKVSHNLLNSLAVILFCSNMNLKVVNVALRLQLFYFILLVMGFILSSYYNSYLTVYNMRPIFQPNLRTVNDIIRANIKVLVPSHILEELRNNPYVNLTSLESVLVEKSQMEVTKNVKSYRPSFAYVVTHNDWIFIGKLQKNLIQPIYQLSDICFGDSFNTFPIQLKSKFAHALDRFILLVQQSGLLYHWQEEAFTAAIWAKYYRLLQDVYPVDPLNVYYFRLAWIIFLTGSILSCICFIVELKIFKRKNNI